MFVIDVETLSFQIFGEHLSTKKRIYLLFSGIHYDLLVRNVSEKVEHMEMDLREFETGDI